MKTKRPKSARNAEISNTLQRLRQHLEILNLTLLASKLDDTLAWATHESPTPTVLLERALGEEARVRLENRIEAKIKKSGLGERKNLETFDFAFQPGMDRAIIMQLAELDFIRRADDLLITGKTGTGKSHVLQAIALRACQAQFSVRYVKCRDLIDDLYKSLADDSHATRIKLWAAPDLLVVDDVGLGQVRKRGDEPTAAHMLFDLLDRRHAKSSTAMTSNIKLSDWGRYLGDPTLAAAILDRVVMRAIRIDVDGPSYRQRVARDRAESDGRSPPEEPNDRDGAQGIELTAPAKTDEAKGQE